MPNGLFYLNSLGRYIFNTGLSGKFLLLPCFVEISKTAANNVDPDQTLRSVASNLVYTICQCPFYHMTVKLFSEITHVIKSYKHTCNNTCKASY